MKTPTRFVNKLSDEQREELHQAMKTGNEQICRRAHAVLLNARGYSVDHIADIYEVDRDTVSHWLTRWEDDGRAGLADQAGRGLPAAPTLTFNFPILRRYCLRLGRRATLRFDAH